MPDQGLDAVDGPGQRREEEVGRVPLSLAGSPGGPPAPGHGQLAMKLDGAAYSLRGQSP